MPSTLSTLDLDSFIHTKLENDPFPYLIVPRALRAETLAELHADYPKVKGAGSFPLRTLSPGPAFKRLVEDLDSDAFREACEQKFSMDLSGRPSMITVRGEASLRDGKIHTDTDTKLITVLIYMNPSWESDGGRLRLLRNGTDLEDVIAEVPPIEGTLLAFKVSKNSWHGHKQVEGPRRVIQFNYVTHKNVVMREQARHYVSAWVKGIRGSESTQEYK
jgi:hypothetical protein